MDAWTKIDGIAFVIGNILDIRMHEKMKHPVSSEFDHIVARLVDFEAHHAMGFIENQ